MNVALETNILVHGEGVNGAERSEAVLNLFGRLQPISVFVPTQAVGGFFNVLVRKAGRRPHEARAALPTRSDTFPIVATTTPIMHAAADLAADHRFGIWDCVILASAADAGCRLLLSEGMQEGFTWRGVTVADPIAPVRHELFEALLASPTG